MPCLWSSSLNRSHATNNAIHLSQESFVTKMVQSKEIKAKFCLWGLGGNGRRPHGQEKHGEKREKLMPHIKTFARVANHSHRRSAP